MKNFRQFLKKNWWKYLIIVVVIALDMTTKFLLVPNGEENFSTTVLIPGVLEILPVHNTGAGFSILSGKTWFLILLSAIFLVAYVTFDILFKRNSVLYEIASACIIAGAIGNLIDRVAFGYVRDFVYLKFINFPVFNVADISLTVGCVLLIVYMLISIGKDKKETKKDENEIDTQSK